MVNEDVPPEFGPEAAEEHLIPLVDAIVPGSNPATRTLYVTPPAGLLQLGRQRMVLASCAQPARRAGAAPLKPSWRPV